MSKKIITDQEDFFNQNALIEKDHLADDIFSKYANKEQVSSLKWLDDKKVILDYGVGTATSIDVFLKNHDRGKYMFYGVDIAEQAIKKARKKYPEYKFYKISKNKIPQIKNNSIDGAYMFHVLHHARDHEAIFTSIYDKLNKNGKFLINDLSSNNAINKAGRNMFVHLPLFVKKRFGDDLVVGESIPEKYKVDTNEILKKLRKVGFRIEKVEYGHLFFFVFGWIDRFIPFSKSKIILVLYYHLISLETRLLQYQFFKNKAEVLVIKCKK